VTEVPVATSLDERGEFYALSAPLPADLRTDLAGLWDAGEQEGALAALISALTEADAPLTDSARGRIAVLAESWGCWAALGGPLAACRRNEQAPETAALVERTAEGDLLEAAITARLGFGNPWPGHTLVAWFACRRCPDVLARVHKTEPWGPDLIASSYVLLHLGGADAAVGGTGRMVRTVRGTARRGEGAPWALEIRGAHHTGWPAFSALLSTHRR
jgi:hypothetical protein